MRFVQEMRQCKSCIQGQPASLGQCKSAVQLPRESRAYLHLKVELQWFNCCFIYYGCGYGPVQVRKVFRICEDHEDSEPVSYTGMY